MELIQAEKITRGYQSGGGRILALDQISLSIGYGEFVAVTGPSGSGKSTLISLIGLLDTPSSGLMTLEGEDISNLSNERMAQIRNQRIGFVFQAYSLLARSTAIENVELPLVYAGISRKNRKIAAREALQSVGLSKRQQHWPAQLSGGEQQRVAIARACVTQPALILADEPTGALDSQTGHEILSLFQELHESGTTIILVTHDKDVAGYARRRVELKDGKILRDEA